MTENQQLPAAPITVAEQLQVPDKILIDLTPVQKGWLSLAVKRQNTTAECTRCELAVQGFLKDIANETKLETVQENIKKAKAEAATGKDCRLQFTRNLDEKLINPLMEFEKRNEKGISQAEEHEKKLRILKASTTVTTNALQTEKSLYKAHIENEQERIGVLYKNTLSRRINFYYVGALEQDTLVNKIAEYKQEIINELPNIELPIGIKMNTTLIPLEEKKVIYDSVTKYDGKDDLASAIKEVETKFAMYEQDLKNKSAAISTATLAQESAEKEAVQEVEINSSINKLAATAGTVTFDIPKIKESQKIIEIENWDFVVLVLTNFMKKIEKVKPRIKVKSLMKLSIQQIVNALSQHITETGEQLVGLKTEKEVK